MKKIVKLFVVFSILIIGIMPINADEAQKGPVLPQTISVDKTVSVDLMSGGCYGYAKFRVRGTYVYYPSGQSVGSINLTTTMIDHTSDWTVNYDGATYTASGSKVKVVIRYNFIPSHWDCPYVPPQYNATTIYV